MAQAVERGGISSVAHRRVTPPAGESEEFTYVQTIKLGTIPDISAGVVEYAFLRNGTLYDVIFVSTPERAGELKPVFEGIARSFQYAN